MFRGGPARFSAGEGPTKDRYGSQSKANSRSIRGRLCFPKVPVPSDHETPNSFSVVRRMVVISSVPSMSSLQCPLGATEHSGPGRTTAFTLERFSSSVSDAYLYRFDLPEESLESVAIKMRGAEGNGDRSRQAVAIAAMGKLDCITVQWTGGDSLNKSSGNLEQETPSLRWVQQV
jgi:hypothetical protein